MRTTAVKNVNPIVDTRSYARAKTTLWSWDAKSPAASRLLTFPSPWPLSLSLLSLSLSLSLSTIPLCIHPQGTLAGPLDGIPYAAKDNFCTLGVRTTASSAALAGFTPPYDSTPTGRLRRAGSPLIGKTNMDEFGMGSGTLFSDHGRTLNPWSPRTYVVDAMCACCVFSSH